MIYLSPATPTDIEAIASLLTEVDRYYGATEVEPLAERIPKIRHAVFGEAPSAYVLLAREDDRLVGLASYSYLWPAAGVSRAIFLKELYVTEESRHRGVGRLLMRELCRIAKENGCDRVDWTVDTDNPSAEQFYATLGVAPLAAKRFYRLAGEALEQLAASPATAQSG